MSWEFLNIFKKEDLNKLIFSIMVPGWILFLFCGVPEPINYYILGIAIFASVFCISGVFVYYYKKFQSKWLKKRQARNRELLDKEKDKNRKIEINRMFEGLTVENKNRLAYLLLKGKEDSINSHILHFSREYDVTPFIEQAQYYTSIYNDKYGLGQSCIEEKYYKDSIAIVIDPYLYDLVKSDIDERGLHMENV